MTGHELAEYCRSKGFFVEKVKEWRTISIQAHQSKAENQYKQDSIRSSDKNKIKALEKELARKNQALAETAALLVLREKFNALWETSEEDKRPTAKHPEPSNKLSDEEQQQIVDICNEPEFADLPPNKIVPTLADRGIYIVSESTFYGVLKARNQLVNRTRSKSMRKYYKPKAQMAC
jgi:hypothetical protein